MTRRRLLGSHQDIIEGEKDSGTDEKAQDKLLVYDGIKENLEPAEMGKNGRVKKPGAKKFFINRKGDKYKLIAIWNCGKGVRRSFAGSYAPKKLNERGRQDAASLKYFASLGMSGAHTGDY